MEPKSNPIIPDKDKICSVNKSSDVHRLGYLKNMVKSSEYICSACGRAASSKEAICDPEDVKGRSPFDSTVSENREKLSDFGLPEDEKVCSVNDYDSSLRMDVLKGLAQNARFVCSACGRVASVEEDVCSPEKI
jgi:hypothetical protein